MKKTKKLTCLSDLLQYWEDLNHMGRFNFETSLLLDGMAPNRPQIGSELTKNYGLGREIENYTFLRHNLTKQQQFNADDFLPRVPKEFKGKTPTKLDFLMLKGVEACLFAPLFLEHWIQTKRVCEVNQNKKVELIDPGVENYLPYLPYSSFLLTLKEPLCIPFIPAEVFDDKHKAIEAKKTAKVLCYKEFIVYRDDDNGVVQILALPERLPEFLVPVDLKDNMNNAIRLLKLNRKKEAHTAISQAMPKMNAWMKKLDQFLLLRFDVKTGEFCEPDLEGQLLWHKNICTTKIKSLFIPADDDDAYFKTIIDCSDAKPAFFINGIGKLFKEYTTPEVVKVYNFSTEDKPAESVEEKVAPKTEAKEPDPEQVLPWDEVSIGGMMFVQFTKKAANGVSIKTGSEKGFHYRRPHDRKVRDRESGQIKYIAKIPQTKIRPDKEHLNGASAKIN